VHELADYRQVPIWSSHDEWRGVVHCVLDGQSGHTDLLKEFQDPFADHPVAVVIELDVMGLEDMNPGITLEISWAQRALVWNWVLIPGLYCVQPVTESFMANSDTWHISP